MNASRRADTISPLFEFTEADTPTLSTRGLTALARGAAGFLFPSRCLACRARPVERLWQGGVCETCWSALPEPDPERCASCDEAMRGALTLRGSFRDPTDERGNGASELSPSNHR
ncbi:MAG: double zinc ribbon domain-containing protein [Syntrophomonadaceae bacterium]